MLKLIHIAALFLNHHHKKYPKHFDKVMRDE